ncbi:PEP-CTERM sorting domain-containing protein [Prosthecobacter sp.]|nr:PEP-CTERM sorting domain-containing protein [Prosthecobacter sp.]MDZ4403576.1 PEP-CTERM sorting domain-containing protein [Prosthecobacter sp.]
MPFTANFDLDNATLAPEPSRAMLLLVSLVCLKLHRRREVTAGTGRASI